MKKDTEPNKPVSVEDLLRLKRAEQPRDEFWSGWQRELRSKLSEAAEQRPSFISRALPRVWIAVARWHIPVGATALAALSFIAIREYNSPLPALSAPAPSVSELVHADAATAGLALMSELRAADGVPAPVEVSRGVTNSLAMPGGQDDLQPAESRVTLAIAANLAKVRTLDPEIMEIPYTLHGKSPLTVSEEPLARAAASRDTRRERLLGFHQTAAHAPAVLSAARSNLRVPSRLNEDPLTENTVRRLEARGDMFSLRF